MRVHPVANHLLLFTETQEKKRTNTLRLRVLSPPFWIQFTNINCEKIIEETYLRDAQTNFLLKMQGNFSYLNISIRFPCLLLPSSQKAYNLRLFGLHQIILNLSKLQKIMLAFMLLNRYHENVFHNRSNDTNLVLH
jgi:hypothetical protein